MTSLIASLIALANKSPALSLTVKMTAIVGLALAATWCLRGSRAALRHALVVAMFIVILALPVSSLFTPQLQIPIRVAGTAPFSSEREPQVTGVVSLDLQGLFSWLKSGNDTRLPLRSQVNRDSASLVWISLRTVWAVGSVIFLLPLLVGAWQIRRIRRSGIPCLPAQSIVNTLRSHAGMYRTVCVVLHEKVSIPGACGVFRPLILLPIDAEQWESQDLTRALLHEMEHVKRWDSLCQHVARIACALYWFHPLAWAAWRKLRLEAERACDDVVVQHTEATGYADQLVRFAKRQQNPDLPLLAMARRADLTTRVRAVLNDRVCRKPLGLASAVLVTVGVIAAIFASSLTLVAAPQDQQQSAQVTAGKAKLAFEVVSIKLNNSGSDLARSGRGPDGRFGAENVPLRELIEHAYGDLKVSGLADLALSGLPDWAEKDRYDIQAKPEAGTTFTPQALQQMLQSMLEDRFKLKMRRETKDTAVYALVVGKNGVKMKQSADQTPIDRGGPLSSAPPPADAPSASGGPARSGARAPPPPQTRPSPGQPTGVPLRGNVFLGVGRLRADALTAERLAEILTRYAERKVIDKTGLTALYEVDLSWRPEQDVGINTTSPDWFTAIQEQLGLRLVPQTAPVDSFVVEHIERPSDN